MTGIIEARMKEKGITLHKATTPMANYLPYTISGYLVFVSGQGPVEKGVIKYIGKLGREFSTKDGYQAARLSAMNLLAQLSSACDGDLDRVTKVLKISGFVNSTADFLDQPQVINGASDLLVEVFGEQGRHARFAVGNPSLPGDVAVELDGVFEIRA